MATKDYHQNPHDPGNPMLDAPEETRPAKRRGRKPKDVTDQKQIGQKEASNPPLASSPTGRLLQKIAAVTKLITRLEKKDASGNHDYKFVSIDAYYEEVALKIAREHGLCWNLQESPDREQRFDTYGDTHIRKVYNVSMFDETGDAMSLQHAISVTMSYEGASTAGKMLSYADKAFMRQLFKIPTSEPDGDSSKPVTKPEHIQQKNADAKDKFFEVKPDGQQPKAQ